MQGGEGWSKAVTPERCREIAEQAADRWREQGLGGGTAMRPDKHHPAPRYATRQNTIALPTIVAVAVAAYWVWRDGFSWGDLLGGLLIWVVAFGTLAALRWHNSH